MEFRRSTHPIGVTSCIEWIVLASDFPSIYVSFGAILKLQRDMYRVNYRSSSFARLLALITLLSLSTV